MEILDWIQDWFQYNCDGKWEKGNGIQITTSDVPHPRLDFERKQQTRLVWCKSR